MRANRSTGRDYKARGRDNRFKGAAACLALILAACGPENRPIAEEPKPGALGRTLEAGGPPADSTQSGAVETPYVVIRFDRPGIPYEDTLYEALRRALERYPRAEFDVVLALPPIPSGRTPTAAFSAGEDQIEDIVLAMTDMGLPPTRLRIAAITDPRLKVNEIRLFVRPPSY